MSDEISMEEVVIMKAERFADGDDGSLPDAYDNLSWSQRYAFERGQRYLRYAAKCAELLAAGSPSKTK